MDFLKNIATSTKIVLSIGLVLVVALVFVATQWRPEAKMPKASPSSPVKPEPSKDNVSKLVQEQIDHLKAVVAKNPADAKSSFELARMLQDGHDSPGAMKYYELGLKADPKNIEARVDYSLCLYQTGKLQEAFSQNAIVLKQDASNAHALYNIGALYGNRGMSDSAAYYWRKLISSHPHDQLAQQAQENLKKLSGNINM